MMEYALKIVNFFMSHIWDIIWFLVFFAIIAAMAKKFLEWANTEPAPAPETPLTPAERGANFGKSLTNGFKNLLLGLAKFIAGLIVSAWETTWGFTKSFWPVPVMFIALIIFTQYFTSTMCVVNDIQSTALSNPYQKVRSVQWEEGVVTERLCRFYHGVDVINARSSGYNLEYAGYKAVTAGKINVIYDVERRVMVYWPVSTYDLQTSMDGQILNSGAHLRSWVLLMRVYKNSKTLFPHEDSGLYINSSMDIQHTADKLISLGFLDIDPEKFTNESAEDIGKFILGEKDLNHNSQASLAEEFMDKRKAPESVPINPPSN